MQVDILFRLEIKSDPGLKSASVGLVERRLVVGNVFVIEISTPQANFIDDA